MNHRPHNGLSFGLGELDLRLYGPLLDQCCADYELWLREHLPEASGTESARRVAFLKFRIGEVLHSIAHIRRLYAQFASAVGGSVDPEDQKQFVLKFARDLGATPAELAKDEVAFARWFDVDAMTDRYHRRHARHEQYAAFLLGRLAAIARQKMSEIAHPEEQIALWQELQLETARRPRVARACR